MRRRDVHMITLGGMIAGMIVTAGAGDWGWFLYFAAFAAGNAFGGFWEPA